MKFGVVDLEFNKKLARLFDNVFEKEVLTNVHAIALQLTNNKFFVCDKLERLEDWLENLENPANSLDVFINKDVISHI